MPSQAAALMVADALNPPPLQSLWHRTRNTSRSSAAWSDNRRGEAWWPSELPQVVDALKPPPLQPSLRHRARRTGPGDGGGKAPLARRNGGGAAEALVRARAADDYLVMGDGVVWGNFHPSLMSRVFSRWEIDKRRRRETIARDARGPTRPQAQTSSKAVRIG